jgi:hypothetical protein
MLASDAATGVYHPEGSGTKMLIAFMIAMGIVMGLVFATRVAKEWSR